jgi:hypothetical protein
MSTLLLSNEDEDKPSSFETELATMDYMEDDFSEEILMGEV